VKKENRGIAAFYYQRALEADSTNKNAKGKLDGLEIKPSIGEEQGSP
jgi:hypothetical protein